MNRPAALFAACFLSCLPSLCARASGLILTPPDLTQAAGPDASVPPFASRLELGLSTGELVGDAALRSMFLGISLAILCIGGCATASSPWPVTMWILLLHPALDGVLVWAAGSASPSYQPRLLWTMLASYGGALVEGALILIGVLTGTWGLTVALGLVGSAAAAAGTVYVQLRTKVPVEPDPAVAPAASGRSNLLTLAMF